MSRNYTFGDFRKKEKEKEAIDIEAITVDPIPKIDDQCCPVTQLPVTQLPSVGSQQVVGNKEKVGSQKSKEDPAYPSRAERQQLGVRLQKHKVEQYKIWCFINKISLQDAIEMAMDRLVGSQDLLDSKLPSYPLDHDLDPTSEDPIDDKLSSIMEFYSKWTGNKVKEGDKENYKNVANLDTKVIQIGILLTVFRAKNRIGSFRYCLGAIEEVSKQKIDNTDYYLKYLTDKVMKKNTIK